MDTEYPRIGVIEGFYGRPWSVNSRLQMMDWLAALGCDSYLYAPKADACLRKGWRDPWPDAERARLGAVARRCRDTGLAMYVGLSPYAIYEQYDPAARATLRERIEQIMGLGVQGVALLFDDMPGSTADLAARQSEICSDALAWSGGRSLLMCPTYYSDDPVLDRVFGHRPSRYLEQLCATLEPDITPFWTGPEVCSASIDSAHLDAVRQRCGRPVALWDNYPVNDSKARSAHLYLEPLTGRDASGSQWLHSHWCNAMNQPALSLPALASLPALYGRGQGAVREVFAAAGLDDALREACGPLARQTCDELSPGARAALQRAASGPGPAAAELRDWLAGGWEFDPACLTD